MGWWSQDEEGNSFAAGSELIWGDEPADIIADALDRIDAAFGRAWGRKPTLAEVRAGVNFSAAVRFDSQEAEKGTPDTVPYEASPAGMTEAHAEGLHSEMRREGCPECRAQGPA